VSPKPLLNLAGLCVLVPDNANRLAGTFPGARVGGSPLAAHGQAPAVPDSTITIYRLKALQIALQLATKIAFDQHLVAGNRLDNFVDLMRRQILRPQVRIDIGLFQNALRPARSDPVDVGQGRFDAFIGWNFNS